MRQEKVIITKHKTISSQYRLISFLSSNIARRTNPGQFIHISISSPYVLTLRRPFSIFDVEGKTISILYKIVGRGTEMLASLKVGEGVDVIGPLGNGFPKISKRVLPVLIAGGYGAAALYLLAKRSASKGILFIGAGTSKDLLCLKDFSKLGWQVYAATEDGSCGDKGLVTEVLENWLMANISKQPIELFACGPTGMLKRLTEIAMKYKIDGWVSLDKHMGCGIGVCLACVQKIKDASSAAKWRWARVCKEGPVFNIKDVEWS